MEAPPLHGFTYSLQFHQLFPRLVSQHGIPLVPFLLSGVVFNPDLNLPDGVHPNAAGARRIADTVWLYLEPLIRAELASAARTEDERRGPVYVTAGERFV
jgi:acyl-CoA thioesterase-1